MINIPTLNSELQWDFLHYYIKKIRTKLEAKYSLIYPY